MTHLTNHLMVMYNYENAHLRRFAINLVNAAMLVRPVSCSPSFVVILTIEKRFPFSINYRGANLLHPGDKIKKLNEIRMRFIVFYF